MGKDENNMAISLPSFVVVLFIALGIYSAFPGPEDMFVRFPLVGRAFLPTANQTVKTPYHNYGANGLIIHGWADPAAVSGLLANKAFHPVINSKNGKAIATFWVVDYRDTSVGPYKELVVVFTVADKPGVTVDCTTIHCVNIINTKPGVRQYIHKLWLDEDLPIEYGRILLGCDKYKAEIAISEKNDNWNFDFTDTSVLAYGSLLTGSLKLDSGFVGGYIAHLPYLIWEMGLVKATFFVINPQEFIRWAATGPPGIATGLVPAVPIDASPLWGAIFVTDPRFTWATPQDKLQIGKQYAPLNFEPVLYQHDTNLRAILLGAWGHAAQPEN